jgi:hypothetical protein
MINMITVISFLTHCFYLETDGQTEIVNQETERFIQTYVNY